MPSSGRHSAPAASRTGQADKSSVVLARGRPYAPRYIAALNAVAFGVVSLVAMVGGGILGQLLGRLMPSYHRDNATREAVTLATGLIITVTSMTLSLLLYSTKAAFDRAEADTRAYAASIIVLDRSLNAYGPEAGPARALLRGYTERAVRSTWPEEFGGSADFGPIESQALGRELAVLHDAIRNLHTATPYQELVAAECRSNMNDLISRRFALVENVQRSIPPPLLAGVIAWLAVIFVSLGLNTPGSPVLMVTLGVCALVAASCITLMDEMDGAFDGSIKVSSEPMRDALANLDFDAGVRPTPTR